MPIRLVLAMVVLALFKLWLVHTVPLSAWSDCACDDEHFLNQARSLIQGEWLGAYDQFTLIKGPVYPLWVALVHHIGLPLLLCDHLLYLAAGFLLVFVLRPYIRHSAALFFLFALYAFNVEMIPRLSREGIYVTLPVLVLSGFIGVHAWRGAGLLKMGAWALFSGIMLLLFWLTREEGLWLAPSLYLLVFCTLIRLYRTFKRSRLFLVRALICLAPFAVSVGGYQVIALINYSHYGTYTVVETVSEPYVSAYAALQRPKHPCWQRFIPIPREVRFKLYDHSPAFKEIMASLETHVALNRAHPVSTIHPHTSGETHAGWFIWALRDSVAQAGHHESSGKANAYYRCLAREINQACDEGLLDSYPERSTLAPPIHEEYWPLLGQSILRGAACFADYSGCADLYGRMVKNAGMAEEDTPVYLRLFNGSSLAHPPGFSFGREDRLHLFREVTGSEPAPWTVIETGERAARDSASLALGGHGEVKQILLEGIEKVYRILFPTLACAALLLYGWAGCLQFFLRRTYLFVVTTAVLFALLTRLGLLAYLDVTSFPAFPKLYLLPLYPLLYLFVALTLIDLVQQHASNFHTRTKSRTR